MKKSFVLYADFKSTIDKLPDEEAGKLFKLIIDFANGIDRQADSLLIDIAFTPIKQQMIRDKEKYEAQLVKRKEAGSLGGKAKAKIVASATSAKQVVASAKQMLASAKSATKIVANVADNDNVNVNVNDTVTDNVNYKKWDIQQFKDDINKHRRNLPDSTLKKFFNYWSEKDPKGKMKFQLQKTWETNKRLSTWANNNFNANTNEVTTRASANKITLND